MDVLDDLCGEAAEVTAMQPWLTYSQELHRLREWGTSVKARDTLDEAPMGLGEMPKIVGGLLGGDACDGLPHPELDWEGFIKAIDEKQKALPEVYDPMRKRRRPWLDLRRLKQAKSKGCAIC